LRVSAICKSFRTVLNGKPQIVEVLRDLSLGVKQSEILSLFGPNGCGKTTLLNVISGILAPDSGQTRFFVGAESDPRVGFVFQNYRESLFPWLTVTENVAFPLTVKGVVADQRKEQVQSLMESLGLAVPLEAFPYQLSGGQLQMVAIGRALVTKPDILLLDEPFSALDYQTRLQMQLILSSILQKVGITTVIVSHDVDEAIFLADRVVVLTKRPASVVAEVAVRFSRPRNLGLMESPEFGETRAEVLRLFREVALGE
jgi:NitT/TauT family transport system ATP-binding protein